MVSKVDHSMLALCRAAWVHQKLKKEEEEEDQQ